MSRSTRWSFGSCGVNPLDTQFFIYVGNLLQGELGISYHTNRPVIDMLREQLWNTVLLIGAGQILAIILGMVLGVLAAWKARTPIDYGALVDQPDGLEPAHLLAGHHPAFLGQQPTLACPSAARSPPGATLPARGPSGPMLGATCSCPP